CRRVFRPARDVLGPQPFLGKGFPPPRPPAPRPGRAPPVGARAWAAGGRWQPPCRAALTRGGKRPGARANNNRGGGRAFGNRRADAMNALVGPIGGVTADWRERLALVVATMREMSSQTDPQEMGRAYRQRMRRLLPIDNAVSLSRRDLAWPRYRITRSTLWNEEINPWKEKDRVPVHEGGLLAELIYGDEPRLFDDLRVGPGDPAAGYLAGHRSVLAVPLYDGGVALNMVLLMRREPGAFRPEQFPEVVWMSNLF